MRLKYVSTEAACLATLTAAVLWLGTILFYYTTLESEELMLLSKMRSQQTQSFWLSVAAPTAIHKSDYIFNFHTNQFWFFPLYGRLSKQKGNNVNFTLSTAEKNEKAVKAKQINQNVYILNEV